MGTTGSLTTPSIQGHKLRVYTYKPSGTLRGILFVFHGISRTASSYRDAARRTADRLGLYVYAPLFDSDRFPSNDYQMGGVRVNGPTTGRTIDMVDDLIRWGKGRLPAGLPVYLYGHSAGAQFLSRTAAYTRQDVARILVANPSTHVQPSVAEKAPYGFDMRSDDGLSSAEATLLTQYLAAPVTIYLGSEDNDPNDDDLATGPAAMRQGEHRLERGINTFNRAQTVAETRKVPFNWRLVIADGIGHAGGEMIRAPEVDEALGLV